jgi:hypothetical protein
MKSTQEIIQDLSELKASLRADGDQPLQMDNVLDRVLGRVIDLANAVKTIEENIPHKASQKETNEIFED